MKYTDPRLAKADITIRSMSRDHVEDLWLLFSTQGRSAIDNAFSAQSDAEYPGLARFMAMFSNAFISYQDFEDVYIGFCTIGIYNLKAPTLSNDGYKGILQGTFDLPDEMAEAISKQIETEDAIGAGKDLGTFAWMVAKMKEGAREAANWLGRLLPWEWEIDQTQAYDVDRLYEFKLLGGKVKELSSRARLMNSQVQIQKQLGVLMLGDPSINDQDAVDAAIGDIFRRASSRNLPHGVMGGASPLARMGKIASMRQAVQALEQAGYKANAQTGDVMAGPVGDTLIKNAVDKIINMKPSTAMLLGGALGLTPLAIMAMSKKFGHHHSDETGDAYSTIETHYGKPAADMWQMGDAEGFMGEIMDLASQNITTGDPDLDAEIEGDVMADGDDYGDPEIGGIFRRARANRLKKKAARISRRNARRSGRQRAKNRERAEIERSRQIVQDANEWTPETMSYYSVNSVDPTDDGGPNYENEQTSYDSGNGMPSVDDFNSM